MSRIPEPQTPRVLFSGRVPAEAAGERLDRFLAAHLPGMSRVRVQDFIKEGGASLSGQVCLQPSRRLEGGEELALRGQETSSALVPSHGELRVLYHDRHLAVLDKPPGLTVHPAPGIDEETLVHRLLGRFPQIAVLDDARPGIVHRLDKDTSGLMLVALAEPARLKLARDFAAREVHKTYLALVHGRPARDTGHIEADIGRHPTIKSRMAVVAKGGREAKSDWRVLWATGDGRFSLLAVRIHTGRTHQIRVHLAHIGHPILGDRVYGGHLQAEWARAEPLAARLARRQMLHAHRLAFHHPEDGREMAFTARPPLDFRRLPPLLDRRLQRVVLVGMPGSGKSTLLSLLAARGVPTFSADAAVAALYAPGEDGWTMLRARFGTRFVPEARGPVDKKALFAAMAADARLRREVNDLVHPLVRHRLAAFYTGNAKARLAVAEVPLLLEAGWRREDPAEVVVGIRLAPALRARLMQEGRRVAPETMAVLDSWQWPEDRKLAACDLIVENSGNMEELAAAADRLLSNLRGRRVAGMRALLDRLEALYQGPASGEGGA